MYSGGNSDVSLDRLDAVVIKPSHMSIMPMHEYEQDGRALEYLVGTIVWILVTKPLGWSVVYPTPQAGAGVSAKEGRDGG